MNKFIKLNIKCEEIDEEDIKLSELLGKEAAGNIFYKPILFNISHIASVEPNTKDGTAFIVVPTSQTNEWVALATQESYKEVEKLIL